MIRKIYQIPKEIPKEQAEMQLERIVKEADAEGKHCRIILHPCAELYCEIKIYKEGERPEGGD